MPLEAKFRAPRCPEMFASKQFEKLWRPTLHLVCAIAHGVVECYYVMDHDQRKDSNMNISLIMRTVDVAKKILEDRGAPMPHHIALQADNTCREQRNQHVFMFSALITAKQLWSTISLAFYIPGHSHNEVGQRFVPVAAALSRAKRLETCDDSRCLGLDFACQKMPLYRLKTFTYVLVKFVKTWIENS